MTLLKTGMRVGELCNLDLRDLRLSGAATDAYELGDRPQLDGRGDSPYVAADVARDEVVNGEKRSAANKHKRATVVPVDAELAAVLARWLAIRPDALSRAEPLFVSTSGEWGRRLTPQMVRNAVESHARDAGWYRTGDVADDIIDTDTHNWGDRVREVYEANVYSLFCLESGDLCWFE